MESGHQRRALARPAPSPPPKIADHCNPRMGDLFIGYRQFAAYAGLAGRLNMPDHRLPMTNHRRRYPAVANALRLTAH